MIKKIAILVVLVLVASLSIAGCVTDPDLKLPSSSSNNGGTGEAGVAVKINSQTTKSQLGSGYAVSTPQAGYEYVIFDVTVTNLNQNDLAIGSPIYFKLSTSDGTAYSYSSASYYTNNEIELVSHTNAGEKVTGQVAFEIPQSATPTQLVYNDYVNQVTTNL